jgi:hypothetical protein
MLGSVAAGAGTVCARGAYWALLGGPSTSPLGSSGNAFARRLHWQVLVATITYAPYLRSGQAR